MVDSRSAAADFLDGVLPPRDCRTRDLLFIAFSYSSFFALTTSRASVSVLTSSSSLRVSADSDGVVFADA